MDSYSLLQRKMRWIYREMAENSSLAISSFVFLLVEVFKEQGTLKGGQTSERAASCWSDLNIWWEGQPEGILKGFFQQSNRTSALFPSAPPCWSGTAVVGVELLVAPIKEQVMRHARLSILTIFHLLPFILHSCLQPTPKPHHYLYLPKHKPKLNLHLSPQLNPNPKILLFALGFNYGAWALGPKISSWSSQFSICLKNEKYKLTNAKTHTHAHAPPPHLLILPYKLMTLY